MMEHVVKQPSVQDAIQELGNIGIGAAGTALSFLLHQSVKTGTSRLGIIDDICLLNRQQLEDRIIGILFPYDKDVQGYGLFLLEEDFAIQVLSSRLKRNVDFKTMDKASMALLQEICSIMMSSYLSGLASFADIRIRVQLPAVSMDMMGSIINDGLSFILRQEKDSFWLDHELQLNTSAKASLLFIMNLDSVHHLMKKLEVPV